ncbi:MAG: amidohydrolase family protein [Saprospiraceae bacterium]|nr:amidohydrolase family protein [Saprospiraceae bacterium]
MKWTRYICLILIGLLFGCSNPKSNQSSIWAITNVTIIDSKQQQLDQQTVLVNGNKIETVGPSAEIDLPQSTEVIDGTGKFLIPGLWDAHVHLTYDQDIGPSMFKLFMVNGVTSIRDTGGQLDLMQPYQEASATDPTETPRLKISGPLLDGLPRVYDGSTPFRPNLSVGIRTPNQAKNRVNELAAAGVDLIKAYEMLQPETLEAVLEAAKKKGLPVTGHVPLSIDVVSASNAGLRSIEHMRNLEMSCTADWEKLMETRRNELKEGAREAGGDLRSRLHQLQRSYAIENQDSAIRAKVLATLAKNNTWLVPTLTILAFRANRVYARPAWREQFKYLPDSIAARWLGSAERLTRMPLDSAGIRFAEWGYDMVGRLPEAGVGVMAGTDTPIAFLTPGFSLHEELRLLVNSGLSPIQALEAATIRPAEYFNLQDELGTVEKGKIADLLLLDANPLDNIENTQRIRAVIKDGHLHNRAQLDAWLQELEGS